mmetsp:Transcript_2839/g.3593  ORF Transcript_2839/g.3593 Transcript_2839/m.3593 type:complete len:237 (-) Transcript_2839:577-1287(-)
MADPNENQTQVTVLDEFDSFCSYFVGSNSSNYLLVGFGDRQQINDVESALRRVDDLISKLTTVDDEGEVLPKRIHFVYGGDPYDVGKPTIAHIVKHLKQNYENRVKIFAVQNDCVRKVEHWVDYVYWCTTEYENDDSNGKRVIWGGFNENQGLKGASRYYLDEHILGKLSGVVCVGGGKIATEEVQFALNCGLPVGWIQCEPKFDVQIQTVNDLLSEKVSKGLLQPNDFGFLESMK